MIKTTSLLIFLLTISLISCNDKKVSELQNKISKLEAINSNLIDSIANVNYQKIAKSNIIGMSSKSILKIGEREKVRFIFNYPDKILSYDVYSSTPDGEPDELILKNLTDNEFEYEFIPSSLGEQRIELIAVFKIESPDNKKILVPINSGFQTTE